MKYQRLENILDPKHLSFKTENELILIGLAHDDTKGIARLKKLLDYTAPEILTLELSEERLEYNKALRDRLAKGLEQKGFDKELIKRWMPTVEIPVYELDVCKGYSEEHNIPLYQIDLPQIQPQEKALFEENIKNLIAKTTEKKMRKKIYLYEKFVKSNWKLKLWDFSAYNEFVLRGRNSFVPYSILGKRDIHMHNRLCDISHKNPGKRIVHVGGAQHMVANKKNPLYDVTLRSYCLESKVYFLRDADKLEV